MRTLIAGSWYKHWYKRTGVGSGGLRTFGVWSIVERQGRQYVERTGYVEQAGVGVRIHRQVERRPHRVQIDHPTFSIFRHWPGRKVEVLAWVSREGR